MNLKDTMSVMSNFVIKLVNYKTVNIRNCKDYTGNSCCSDIVLLNGHLAQLKYHTKVPWGKHDGAWLQLSIVVLSMVCRIFLYVIFKMEVTCLRILEGI